VFTGQTRGIVNRDAGTGAGSIGKPTSAGVDQARWEGRVERADLGDVEGGGEKACGGNDIVVTSQTVLAG